MASWKAALLLGTLLLPSLAAGGGIRYGYDTGAVPSALAAKELDMEGDDFECPLDMPTVLPSINFTSPELPCAMGAGSSTDGMPECVDVAGKVALITGGSTGIGRGTADRLVKAGMKVVATSRAPQNYTEDCPPDQTFHDPGDRCKPVGFDLWEMDQTDPASVAALIQKVKDKYGRIDFLFLNAGRAFGAPIFPPWQAIPGTNSVYDYFTCNTLQAMQQTMDVNFWGTVRVMEEALPLMPTEGYAYILMTSSVNSLVLAPGSIAYTASKRSVNALAEEWLAEHYPNGTNIRVSLLFPGNVKTNIIRNTCLVLCPCQGCPNSMEEIVEVEAYNYENTDLPMMTATEAGEAVYRLVVDPEAPQRVLMVPPDALPFQWKRICRRMAAPMEMWRVPGWMPSEE